jgi:hypothetical protein
MASRLTNKTVAHLRSLRATTSQKSSVPQAVSFVSQVLKRDRWSLAMLVRPDVHPNPEIELVSVGEK